MTVRSKLVICSQCEGTQWNICCHADDLQNIGTCLKCNHRQLLTEQREKAESLHLYNPAEVKKVRQQLYDEQGGKDKLTGLPLAFKDSVTDHNHSTQYVRGVLNRQTNAVLGKIENLWVRYLGYWYPDTLSTFLRKAADYIEDRDDERFIHPAWIKRVNIEFNKLNEASKRLVLKELGQPEGGNGTERRKLFQKSVLTREHTFEKLKEVLERNKV